MHIATLFLLLLFLPLALASESDSLECKVPDSLSLVEAQPLVRVSPMYPRQQAQRGVEACVVLGFGLAQRSGQDERALFAVNPSVIVAPEDGARPFVREAESALAKWLFFVDTHPPSSEMAYYAVFKFEINQQ